MAKMPAHGTVARYRRELRDGNVCDRCRAANTKAKSRQRARAKQRGAHPVLSIVPDVQERTTAEPTEPMEPDEPSSKRKPDDYQHVPNWGRTRQGLESDLKTANRSAPFFNTYATAARALADEIDSVDSRTSKAPLVKQLVDVIDKLKGKDDGGANSFQSLLADLGRPLVAAPTLLDEAEPG
jgi:hypothetical protein